jgi:hypothetical protein
MVRSSVNRKFAVGGLGLAAALFLGANSFPDRAADAARYIFFLAGMLTVLSLMLFFQNAPSSEPATKWIRSPGNFIATLISLAAYGFITPYIGFFPASALFIAALAHFLGFRRPGFIILAALMVLGFVYIIFVHFLGVPVPMGIWED